MNPYKILNLNNNCSKSEIRTAYKKLSLKFHPDKNLKNKKFFNKKFKEISEAYQILYDDDNRKEYDENGNININSYFKDPDKLFESIFKDINPKLADLLKSTYNSFNDALNVTKNQNIINVISNMDKTSIIKKSSQLLSTYLSDYFSNEKFIESNNINNNNDNDNDNNNEELVFKLSDLDNLNNLAFPIEIYNTIHKIKIKIISKDNCYECCLNTEFKSQNISIGDKTYKFCLNDKIHDKYIRTNSYDLLSNIEIGIDDYFDGFLFIFDTFKKNISKSINLTKNKSMIIKFQGQGFPIWSQKTYGDLYINFYLKKNIKRLHKYPISEFFKYSEKIENLMDIINIYD